LIVQGALSASQQIKGESKCSDGWYITGYYVPREDELPDVAEQIEVERVGSLSFSQKFLGEIRTEGWGITRFRSVTTPAHGIILTLDHSTLPGRYLLKE